MIYLTQTDVMAILDKLAECKGITIDWTRGKTLKEEKKIIIFHFRFPAWVLEEGVTNLVCHVEVGIQFPVFDDFGELLPLLGPGIDAGGVVGTGVQHDDRILRNLEEK